MDKGGNFIGWLSVEGKNLSVMLIEEGLCKVLPQAERLTFGKSLFDAEEKANESKKNIWEVSQGILDVVGKGSIMQRVHHLYY